MLKIDHSTRVLTFRPFSPSRDGIREDANFKILFIPECQHFHGTLGRRPCKSFEFANASAQVHAVVKKRTNDLGR